MNGARVGWAVGAVGAVGAFDGVGAPVGACVGARVGTRVGAGVGARVGARVGIAVGAVGCPFPCPSTPKMEPSRTSAENKTMVAWLLICGECGGGGQMEICV
jgi:hypothetical protein